MLLLRARMNRLGITTKELAKKVGMTEATLTARLNGYSEFKCSEMFAIQKCFPEYILDELFSEVE